MEDVNGDNLKDSTFASLAKWGIHLLTVNIIVKCEKI